VGRCLGVGLDLGVGLTLGVRVAVGDPVAVAVGVGVGCPTTWQAENSEVLLLGSVAVAVITCPVRTLTGKVTLIVAIQLGAVGMLAEPMKVCPSPLPKVSHCELSKNSTRKVVLGALFKLP